MRAKILNLLSIISTAVHRSVLWKEKKETEKSEKKIQAGSKGKVRVTADGRNLPAQKVSRIKSGKTRLNRIDEDIGK